MPFGMEKLEWLGYAMVKKFRRYTFVLTECTNVTDTYTNTQAPHDGIGRACIASRDKNVLKTVGLSCSH